MTAKLLRICDIAVDRFFASVRVAGPDECWEWTAARNAKGYGVFSVGRRMHTASRVTYAIEHGCAPAGLLVCHKCDNPPCCNPRHLFLGSHADNNRDSAQKGRRVKQRLDERGTLHHLNKLTEDDVLAIYRSSERQVDLAMRFNVTQGHVSRIKRGVLWAFLTQVQSL